MTTNKTFWVLSLIVIIAIFFRSYHFTSLPPGLYPDEAMNGNNALEALRTGDFKVYYPENNGREGLFIGIQAVVLKTLLPLTENHAAPWMLRLPSAIFGVLTVLGIYFLGKELFSKNIGLLAAFFLAISYWHINFSRIGFRAIMAPLLLIWGSYFLLLAIRKGSERQHTHYLIAAITGGVIYALGFYTYIAYRVSPLLLLLVIPFFYKQKNFWRVASIFIITTAIVGLPIGFYYLEHPADFLGRTAQVSVLSAGSPIETFSWNTLKTIGMLFFVGDGNWRHNYSGHPELFWPVGILFALGAGLLFYKTWKHFRHKAEESSFAALFLFLWFILAMLPVVASDEGIPHALRSILMIPPIFLIAAVGARALYVFLKTRIQKNLLVVLTVIFFACLTGETYYLYFIKWAENSNTPGAFNAEYITIAEKINSLPIEMDKYVIVPPGGVLVRGIPMPSQTVMFLTDSYEPEAQTAKHIHYISPDTASNIPEGAPTFQL